MKIFLIRNGETQFNKQNIVQGYNIDAPLTKDGIDEAKKLGKYLSQYKFDQVFTSKLKRTITTAEVSLGVKILEGNQIEYLNERRYGKFEGGTKEKTMEIFTTQSEEFKKLTKKEQLHYTFHHEIESDYAFGKRTHKIFELISKKDYKQIAVFTHGGTIRNILFYYNLFSNKVLFRTKIPNCSIFPLEFTNNKLKPINYLKLKL